jgi:hypothetical protein
MLAASIAPREKSSRTVIWALLVSVSIALGAAHLVENISEVSGRMTPRKLLRAALVSPAWPWL